MQNELDRLHFMDSMRAVLMMLGVVLHSSEIYNSSKTWLLHSEQSSSIANFFVESISTFRMPAFFLVSGYFCLLTLKKYGPRKFSKVRLLRILVPLIFTALTLNSLQALVLEKSGWKTINTENYIQQGDYIAHLWFLTNITAYFLIAIILAFTLSPLMKSIGKVISKIVNQTPMLLLIFIAPFSSIAILSLNKIDFPLYTKIFGFFDIYSILYYSPFFTFGAILSIKREYLDKFSKINPVVSLLTAVIFLKVSNYTSGSTHILDKMTFSYSTSATQWFSIVICFYIFQRLFNSPSRISRFLSDASYSVYLLHHILVILGGLILIRFQVPPTPGLLLLVISTTITTLLIHNFLINRNPILKFLLNGRTDTGRYT